MDNHAGLSQCVTLLLSRLVLPCSTKAAREGFSCDQVLIWDNPRASASPGFSRMSRDANSLFYLASRAASLTFLTLRMWQVPQSGAVPHPEFPSLRAGEDLRLQKGSGPSAFPRACAYSCADFFLKDILQDPSLKYNQHGELK